MFDLMYRDILPHDIVTELEGVLAKVNQWGREQHKDDGTHGDVVAESLELQGAGVGEMIDLPYAASRFTVNPTFGCTWTVAEADQIYLRASRIGQLAFVQFKLELTALTGGAPPDILRINLPEFHVLPLLSVQNTNGAVQCGGVVQWADGTNSNVGPVVAKPELVTGAVPTSRLELYAGPDAADIYALSSTLGLVGSCWFCTEVNNTPGGASSQPSTSHGFYL